MTTGTPKVITERQLKATLASNGAPSAAPGGAAQHPMDSQLPVADRSAVAERLAAIRQAVSDIAADGVIMHAGEQQLAWGNWWRNGGWRNGGWGNWRNGWHNGGWHNWWHNW